jgi:RIO kinase 1
MLTPETRLTGRHRASERKANTAAVLDLIGDANHDERKRRERQGLGMRGVPATPSKQAPAARVADLRDRAWQKDRPAPQVGKGAGQRPEPVEPQPAPPRRRVIISVDISQRRRGPRQNP